MNINIQRMGILLARAKQRSGREVATSDVAAVLWPRLTACVSWVACASPHETTCFLRDVVYYGPSNVLGGEVFSHSGVSAREWISSAQRNAGRILAYKTAISQTNGVAVEQESTTAIQTGARRR